jgi:hypothetical protein
MGLSQGRVVPRTPAPSRRRWARSTLTWAAGTFVAVQLGFLVLTERVCPELRDPEYGYRLASLRARRAAEPGRPLALVLGTSRSEVGIRPDALPAYRTPAGAAPLVFNFSLTNSGVMLQLVCLHRLLAADLRPGWVFVEVLAPMLHQPVGTEESIPPHRQAWADLPVLCGYSRAPAWLYARWGRDRLLPGYSCRHVLLSHALPEWVPAERRRDFFWRRFDRSGWMPYGPAEPSAETYRRGLEGARREYGYLLDDFAIEELPDRALRALLELCRHEGIRAALFLMPEASDFRAWYPPGARERIGSYLRGLGDEYGVAVTDAGDWVEDAAFADGHHLLPGAVDAFTARFGREVVAPLFGSPAPPAYR